MAAPSLQHFDFNPDVLQAAARNWYRRRNQRQRNLTRVATGRLDEVETPERLAANREYLQEAMARRTEAARTFAQPSPALLDGLLAERVIGNRDFLGIEFLEMAMAVSRFVGRVHIRERPNRTLGFGTGFMVAPRLLLTNNHVLPERETARFSEVELDYQKDRFGRPLPVVIAGLDPDAFFLTDRRLDFTLVAVNTQSNTGSSIETYAWVRLLAASGKALIGDPLNIVQHPRGEMKQLVLRANKLVDVVGDFLHYESDTEPGSSGSPVFSDFWDVVALHHSGVPKVDDAGNLLDIDGHIWTAGRDDPDRLAWAANEGIRVSSLVEFISRAELRTAEERELRRQLLEDQPPHPMELAMKQASSAPLSSAPLSPSAPGSVTISIPLQVTVSLGTPTLPGSVSASATPAILVSDSAAMASGGPRSQPARTGSDEPGGASRASTEMQATLEAAEREFKGRDDVANVHLGYVFDEERWITDERALVITQKPHRVRRGEAAPRELPETFRGVKVQVADPSIEDLVQLTRGTEVAEAAFAGDVTALAEEITYQPPSGEPLDEVTDEMRVIAHVSPDAGWTQLRPFLRATERELVIGMYDFGAPHIANTLEALDRNALSEITLVMQPGESVGEGTKEDDLHDEEVVRLLERRFGTKFDNAWVKIGRTNGWVASSYHIKVAVRDGRATWLSSGNWQSSNQPDAAPLEENPRRRTWLDKYNREWHAIVEHEGLAAKYRAYLLNDYENNRGNSGDEALVLPDVVVPEEFLLPAAEEAERPFEYFEPFDETRRFKVRPLLTPDNYHEHALDLVESAQEELLIQNQTFNAPGQNHQALRELVAAVLAKQRSGVEVRIIFRLIDPTKARENLERLKEFGFDMSAFKLQTGCHTKGIIVDRKKVLLGSQNWSNDGVSINRDASLLFDDEPLAKYFAGIFEHDWENVAKQSIGRRRQPIEVIHGGEATPAGMVRLTWKDYMEMM